MEEILDKESYQQMLKLRRDIYYGGGVGFIAGITSTALYHMISMHLKPSFKPSNKNLLVGSLFLSAAGGSFLGALLGGKYSLHNTARQQVLSPHNGSIKYVFKNREASSALETDYVRRQNEHRSQMESEMDASFVKRYEAIKSRFVISSKEESSHHHAGKGDDGH